MTNSAARRRTVAIWVLAPVTAYALSAAIDWAVDHDPLSSTDQDAAATTQRSVDPRVKALQAKFRAATHRYQQRRQTLLRVERDVRRRAQQTQAQREANAARLAAALPASSGQTTTSSSPSSTQPSTGSGSSPAPAPTPAPAPAPAPAPTPPTQTTTGSS